MKERFMQTPAAMAVAASVAAAAATLAATGAEFPYPGKFNPTWESANPGVSYSTDLPTAALLGNGSLGAVNGGDRNRKLFVLTRGDLWSCGDLTNGNGPRNIGPVSFADFEIMPGEGTVASSDTLDLPLAALRTQGRFGRGRVHLTSYVAATEDVFIIEGAGDADDTWTLRLTAHGKDDRLRPGSAGVAGGDSIWAKRETANLTAPGDKRGWTTNATAACSAIGAKLTPMPPSDNGQDARSTQISAKLEISAGKPFAIVVCNDAGRRFSPRDVAAIKAAHGEWWREWWMRSRVTTGDEELDRFYHGQVYLLGAGVRKNGSPPGLYGIWQTTDNPKWHNDFHLNYNYIATFYGCLAANRCEAAEVAPQPLLEYLPKAEENARLRLGSLDVCAGRVNAATRVWLDSRKDVAGGIAGAALYPVALGPRGVSAEGDNQYWSQISDGAFQCAFFCTHWEYTLDGAYLAKVWPLLERTANFMLAWREKEALPGGGYRYNIWDSHWEGSGLQKNSAAALGCTKHLFETLVAAAQSGALREAGVDVDGETLAKWIDMRDHLAELPEGMYEIDGKPVRMLSGVENADGSANPSGSNAVNLESIIPGEMFSFDATPELRELAVNAVEGNIAKDPRRVWCGCNQTPKLFATAVRAGYPAEKAIAAFKTHQLRKYMQKNFHINDGVHGVEKIGAMEFIHSMMLQSDHGYVKVFPNWTGADAAFEGLRAKGCFLLSSEMKDGKIAKIAVKSEQGGRMRLVDPSGGTSAPPDGWTRGTTRFSREPTLERDFRPGESAVLFF